MKTASRRTARVRGSPARPFRPTRLLSARPRPPRAPRRAAAPHSSEFGVLARLRCDDRGRDEAVPNVDEDDDEENRRDDLTPDRELFVGRVAHRGAPIARSSNDSRERSREFRFARARARDFARDRRARVVRRSPVLRRRVTATASAASVSAAARAFATVSSASRRAARALGVGFVREAVDLPVVAFEVALHALDVRPALLDGFADGTQKTRRSKSRRRSRN